MRIAGIALSPRLFPRRLPAWLSAVLLLATALATSAWAGPSLQNGKHEKVLDFDDAVVEGMNKQPLDSLSQISEAQRHRQKPHLYRKRTGFRSENLESLRTARFVRSSP